MPSSICYPSWRHVFINNPNNDLYNEKAEEIIAFTNSNITEGKCLSNIAHNSDLICLSITPITGEIQVFHHLSTIGGNLALPDTTLIALSGFGSEATSVILPPDTFSEKTKIGILSWDEIKDITDPTKVKRTTPPPTRARAPSMYFRKIIHSPPFLT